VVAARRSRLTGPGGCRVSRRSALHTAVFAMFLPWSIRRIRLSRGEQRVTCAAGAQLLELYVLGALARVEIGAMHRHVRECVRCQQAAGRIRKVAAQLCLAVPQLAPSDALRARLMAAAIEEHHR